MAPELFQYGGPRPTTAVDMYSFGVLVWCAACGRPCAHVQQGALPAHVAELRGPSWLARGWRRVVEAWLARASCVIVRTFASTWRAKLCACSVPYTEIMHTYGTCTLMRSIVQYMMCCGCREVVTGERPWMVRGGNLRDIECAPRVLAHSCSPCVRVRGVLALSGLAARTDTLLQVLGEGL